MDLQDINRINLHRTPAQVKAIEAADTSLENANLPTFTELHYFLFRAREALRKHVAASIDAGTPDASLVELHAGFFRMEDRMTKGNHKEEE